MKKCILLINFMLILMLSGCSNQSGGQSDSENVIFEDSSPAFSDLSLLITGSNSSEHLRYWNCSETDVNGVVQPNIHVRFWRNETGFAGSLNTTWKQTGDNSVTLDTAQGRIDLNAVTFFSIDSNDDQFTATNNTNGVLNCILKGPARNDIFSDFVEDDIEQFTSLNNDIKNQDDDIWLCNETNSTNQSNTVQYHFAQNQSATVDNDLGSWFIGDRSEIIVSLPNSVKIIQRVQMSDDLNSFNATSLDLNLECARAEFL